MHRPLVDADREDGGLARRPLVEEAKANNRELRKRSKQLAQENEILRRATAGFARDTLPRFAFPLSRELRRPCPVAVICLVLGFTKGWCPPTPSSPLCRGLLRTGQDHASELGTDSSSIR
jgi:hypothetical protein